MTRSPVVQRVLGAFVRNPWMSVCALTAMVVAPLVAGLIAVRTPPWIPVLDLAMTEFRVRDVGSSHTPLIGLPGRIGPLDAEGSHPGPLSFWALAPTYRLLGSTAWSLLVGSVVLHTTAVVSTLVLARRRGGDRMMVVVAALLTVLVAGYGISVLSEPWNPYLPLTFWVAFLVACWSLVDGDSVGLPVAVAAGSFAAQTHVPYLVASLGVGALALAVWAWRARRIGDGRAAARWACAGLALGAVLWLPPTVDQIRRDPGNYRTLIDHFATPPEEEEVVGLGVAAGQVARRLDPWHLVVDSAIEPGVLVPGSADRPPSPVRGAVAVGVWTLAAGWSLARRDRGLLALHAVVAVGLVVAVASVSRIFGFVWYYLMLWIWGLSALMILASVATAWRVLGPRLGSVRRSTIGGLVAPTALLVALLLSARVVTTAGDATPSDTYLSDVLRPLVSATADALTAGLGPATGADDRYLVAWDDPVHIGSQGYGLLSELERRGFDVRAEPRLRVPATPHRSTGSDGAAARVVLATGVALDRWDARDDAVRVAVVDDRTPDELRELEQLRSEVRAELEEKGLDELVPWMDTQLFALSVDTRLSVDAQARLARMLRIGVPTAVYLTPAEAP
ncbi:ArnT family glycosyltransferase [Actinospongicola halichondriae]|uniref:ArnT family glycosyltransferase n=1 Tax=Actinospongicola halichondriae TaxID=3236844 RepID=UPI003D569945